MKILTLLLIGFTVSMITLPVQSQNEDVFWEERAIVGFGAVSYSHPLIMKYFSSSHYDIFSGQESGTLIVQANVASNPNDFDLENAEAGVFINSYSRSAPTPADINNDQVDDILLGMQDGSLVVGIRVGDTFDFSSKLVDTIKVSSFSKPTVADLDADGIDDIIVGIGDGSLTAFINTNTASDPIWEENKDIFANIFVTGHASPFAIDPDNDGVYDIIVGSEKSGISFLKNTADKGDMASFEIIPYTNRQNPFREIDFTNEDFITPFLHDVNNDGFLDLMYGNKAGEIKYHLNHNIDLINVEPTVFTTSLILLLGAILLSAMVATGLIVKKRSEVKGDPIYLIVVHSIGIAPFKYKFTTEDDIVSDINLAGGAFTGIQAIIQEITGAPELRALDAGENKILITRKKFPNGETSVDILLWATADDPELRTASINLAEYIANNFEKDFATGRFTEVFSLGTNAQVARCFKKWL